jgi:tetratricopeptide (TPR) repeat protein
VKTSFLLAIGFALTCLTPCQAGDSISLKSNLLPVEEQVVEYLAGGQQSKAEELLEAETQKCPGVLNAIESALEFHKDAENQLTAAAVRFQDKQRLFFLMGACQRSRFDIEGARPWFIIAYIAKKQSTEGQCALHVLRLDFLRTRRLDAKTVNKEFAGFAKLADDNPDDTVIRWMVAVQCRNWNRNKEGIQHYQKILQKWDPGPILVHQTFANVLDEEKRHDEALVERRKAVEMEPASWSYDGLANTLCQMGRYQESNEAHKEAIRLDPKNSLYWSNWANNLLEEGKPADAIVVCKRALELDPHNHRALNVWALSLLKQGHPFDAIGKFKEANAAKKM